VVKHIQYGLNAKKTGNSVNAQILIKTNTVSERRSFEVLFAECYDIHTGNSNPDEERVAYSYH
jgi:hypothetical protein